MKKIYLRFFAVPSFVLCALICNQYLMLSTNFKPPPNDRCILKEAFKMEFCVDIFSHTMNRPMGTNEI